MSVVSGTVVDRVVLVPPMSARIAQARPKNSATVINTLSNCQGNTGMPGPARAAPKETIV